VSNKKDWIVDKLERLVKLSRATEPDKPSDEELFTNHTTDAYNLLAKVEDSYDNMTHGELRDVMMRANAIWRIRKKIWNGEDPANIPEFSMMQEIEHFLLHPQGPQKINAIKHYRKQAPIILGVEKSLKESKYFVDEVHERLLIEGKISI